MKKLSLNVENLAVESFETNTAGAQSRGTVHGASQQTVNCTYFLTDVLSCWLTCCDESCGMHIPPEEAP